MRDDPIQQRVITAVLSSAAIAAIFAFVWRQPTTWVIVLVLSAVWIGVLMARPWRGFVCAALLWIVAAVMWFVVGAQLQAIVLAVLGGLSLMDGFRDWSAFSRSTLDT